MKLLLPFVMVIGMLLVSCQTRPDVRELNRNPLAVEATVNPTNGIFDELLMEFSTARANTDVRARDIHLKVHFDSSGSQLCDVFIISQDVHVNEYYSVKLSYTPDADMELSMEATRDQWLKETGCVIPTYRASERLRVVNTQICFVELTDNSRWGNPFCENPLFRKVDRNPRLQPSGD